MPELSVIDRLANHLVFPSIMASSRFSLIAVLALVSCGQSIIPQTANARSSQVQKRSHDGIDNLTGTYEYSAVSPDDSRRLYLTVARAGEQYKVVLNASHRDGHGAEHDGKGAGTVGRDGVLRFSFSDSFFNRGTGTLAHTKGGDFRLSIDIVDVQEGRCMMFYGDSILKRATQHSGA